MASKLQVLIWKARKKILPQTWVRTCADCGRSITRRHGKAIYCKDCAYKRQLQSARKWWRGNDYSRVIAKKRQESKSAT